MTISPRIALTLIISSLSFVSAAQFQGEVYRPDTAFKVLTPTGEKTLGFAGGLNNPQFAMADLNNDGRQDLVAYEKGSGQVKTFINYGTAGAPQYRYRPQYAKNFPEIFSYIKMVDYNCDDVPDLIHRGLTGFSVYRGYYSDNELHFSFYKNLFYSPLTYNSEDFEFSYFPPAAWASNNTGWSRVTSGTNPSATPQHLNAMAQFNSNVLPAGAVATIVSKRFRISNQLGGNYASVKFWIYRDAGAPSNADSVSLYVSPDTSLANATYINRVARSRTINQPDTKGSNGWYQYNFEIPNTIYGDTLYLIFKGTSHNGNNIYIDNIEWITSPFYGDINAYVDPGGDIPGLADIDGDGDLDFFAFNMNGAFINFYKNYQKEHNLPCDSIRVNLKDACWGKVYQGWERTQTLGIECSLMQPNPAPAKVTHTGNTLCFLDYDNDGDYDYFNGNVSFSDIQFLKNGRVEYGYPIDTVISQDTSWMQGGYNMTMRQWPGAFWLDVDQDGKKDLVFSPSAENVSENHKCVAWYKNTGTTSTPAYTYQSDSLFVADMIDMGTGSYPMLYDYNKDGKPDLFVGGDGLFQSNGLLRAQIAYYENTSQPGQPSFTLKSNDFLQLSSLNITGAYPAVGDLNNDGLDDLVIGHSDGTISFYTNTASSSSVEPVWTLQHQVLKASNGENIDSMQMPAPFIYDIDKDGKKDLLIGGKSGWIYYYRNVGNSNQLSLQYQTNKLGMAKADPHNSFSGYSVPFIGKIDNSTSEFLLLGSNSGSLYRYTGFQNGNVTAPYTRIDTNYSFINNELNNWSGYRAAPAVADLDGDGKYEMVLGNILGGVRIFKQSMVVDVAEVTPNVNRLEVYPNPAKDVVYISWNGSGHLTGTAELSIYSVTGQKQLRTVVDLSAGATQVPTTNLAPGTYICTLSSGIIRKSEKLVIMK